MELKNLLFELSSAASAGGLDRATKVAQRELEAIAEMRVDEHGGLIAEIASDDDYTIMLDAHIDEIGFIVTCIDGDFIRVAKCGGIDQRTLVAQEVVVHGKEDLFGVFTSVPPHVKKESDDAVKLEDIAIDCGMKNAQLSEIVSPGDIVTFRQTPAELVGGRVTGKAFDNKASVAAVIAAAKTIYNAPNHPRVIISLPWGEELGLRGGRCACFANTPDEAVAVDVSFGDMPGLPAHECGNLGNGPMIGISPILSRAVTDKLISLAEQKGIAHQFEVMGGTTSTDADVISITKGGVRCGLVSIPLRNMHTPTEVVDLKDIENTAQLLAEYVIAGGVRND